MIRVVLPGLPPSVNRAYETHGHGRRVLSEEGRAYKTRIAHHLLREHPKEMRTFELDIPYGIAVTFVFTSIENPKFGKKLKNGEPAKTASKRRYKPIDADNRMKLFLDALTEATGIDDAQYLDLVVRKRDGLVEETRFAVWRLDQEDMPHDVRLGTL